ncbi:hypothetical protein [Roseomonas xinghualingensis]|uniref:hypothetical protein n=1 Tax=Roseomonas xinghualingensis TaxID=2986475 RepID=UPI0021F0F96C|nr:hypothetical protein [Roseomonas sp. SXEYE001]MCV4207568.1 hypothetical protein [Roseomonas sp. SXEYE001]
MSESIAGPGWRADVRERVAEILDERVPDVRGRVHRARVWPASTKPALLVYGYAERKEPVGQGGYQHQFAVTCSMVVKVLTEAPRAIDAEKQCEALVGQVERAILRAPELFGTAGAVLERCAGVITQLGAEQKERKAEVEATIEFQLAWSETFTVTEPETSPCGEVVFSFHDPSIPTS